MKSQTVVTGTHIIPALLRAKENVSLMSYVKKNETETHVAGKSLKVVCW